jgi:hypothetical protein
MKNFYISDKLGVYWGVHGYPPSLREVAFSSENDGGSLLFCLITPSVCFADSSLTEGAEAGVEACHYAESNSTDKL